jgi:hypothetical protein
MIMEIKRLTPEAYRLHDYLVSMAVGKDKAIKARDLCERLNIPDTRILRKLRAEVNSAISELHKKILTGNNGYYVAGADNHEEAYDQYKEAAYRKIRTGVSLIQEGRRLLEAIQSDGQIRLDLTGYLKPIIESYVSTKTPQERVDDILDDLNDISDNLFKK